MGGGYSNPWANGEKPNVKGRTHQTVNYLSCLIHPIIYYCQKLVELVIAWDGQGMEVKNLNLGKTHFWGKAFFTFGASQHPKCMPIWAIHPHPPFLLTQGVKCIFHKWVLCQIRILSILFPFPCNNYLNQFLS